MKKIKKGKGQKGFTLIELLVVVGIMAALAAIVIPNVAKFVGVGKSQGAGAELDAIQAGMDAAIADNAFLAVEVGTVDWNGTSGSTFEDVPIGTVADPDGSGPLASYTVYLFNSLDAAGKRVDYLRINEPKYGPYTWTESGLVSRVIP